MKAKGLDHTRPFGAFGRNKETQHQVKMCGNHETNPVGPIDTSENLQESLAEPIAKHMTQSPRHLSKDDLVRDAVRLVRELRVDELPVVDEHGAPLGLIDIQDLIAMKVVKETGSD